MALRTTTLNLSSTTVTPSTTSGVSTTTFLPTSTLINTTTPYPTQTSSPIPESPQIRHPFPDIDAQRNLYFTSTINLTPYYITFPKDTDLSLIKLSLSYDPGSTSDWITFNEPLKTISGTPPDNAASNTTISMSISSGPYQNVTTSTQFYLIVHNGPFESLAVSGKVISLIVGLAVGMIVAAGAVVAFIMVHRWKDRHR
ncbi:11211_t:CDS:1 [Paraglomus brasilianum]|uniref:11211_t:CDS:1 n=1 Tax=Paraglomus brasilianum TaxID=144538 RepID=A0A9N8WN13_9GLOM|nr:11211_t:CDS:1 [Paraglomus brasilianum]